MKEANELLRNFKMRREHSARTEFGDSLDAFLLKLNEGRVEAGFSLLTHARLARMFYKAKLKPTDLYAFLKECERAKSFSKYFWFRIRELSTGTNLHKKA